MENNEVMVEVMENENNEVMENEIVPVEVFDDETSEPTLSRKDMIVGGVVLGLATAGAVALGKCAFKGCKAVIKKIKDKVGKKEVVIPTTEPINEKPIEVSIPTETQVEVVETETE